MTAPKRMALAFGCMVAGIAIPWLLTLPATLRFGGWRPALEGLEFLPFMLVFAFPGWLLSLPFILLFKDAKGIRFWAILLIGITVGPVCMLIYKLISTHGKLTSLSYGDKKGLAMSVWVSLPTTLFYALSLLYFARQRGIAEQP